MNARHTQPRNKRAANPEPKPARRNGINTAVIIETYITTQSHSIVNQPDKLQER